MSGFVLGGFAGPGGWCEGLRRLGWDGPMLGVELDPTACATAEAAGHQRLCADVAALDLAAFAGQVEGAILSPPCPTWSAGGLGAGELDAPNVLHLVDDFAGGGGDPRAYRWHDPRSALTAQPMRWAAELRPRWIALEQVPAVLPIWQHTGRRLAELGYSVWCGIVHAEQFGVPQTRRRAALLASLDREVTAPQPTHQRHRADDPTSPLPHAVSMADVCGWPPDDRVGFPRRARPEDVQRGNVTRLGSGKYRAADLRAADQPAFTLTERVRDWRRWPADNTPPHRVNRAEASALQGFRRDYPWRGPMSSQAHQIGNAVPPPLAAAILEQLVTQNAAARRGAAA